MEGMLALIVFAALPIDPKIAIVAGLVIAVVILIAALLLFRSSGKKKGAKQQGASGATDWQRSQQQGMPGVWNGQGQGTGGTADAPWGQQNAQPGGWGMPNAQGQGAQNPAQPAWGGMPGAQSAGQPGGWGMPNAQGQGQGAQNPAQPAWGAGSTPQGGAQDWGMPAMQAGQNPQAGWNTPGAQNSAQTQQPGNWSTPGTPNTSQPQPQPGAWGQQSAQNAGIGNQPAWDATALASSQDAWGQPSPNPGNQSGMPSWGAQPAQQAQTAYGGSGSGQPWGSPGTGTGTGDLRGQSPQSPQSQQAPADIWGQQPAQAPADAWGQQPAAAPQNAWGQPAQAQPAQSWGQTGPGSQGGQGQAASTPAGGNSGTPAWQQPQWGSPGMGGEATMMGDADKTILRPSGPVGMTGFVRVEEGKEPGRIYEIRKEALSIGRSRESDIFLEDLAVSRLHASIVSLGNGDFALKDEGSANGTKVNGQVVNKYQTYPLKEGDKIQLGQTVLVFARR